jgi:threonyl-tRNA synthetase
MQLLLIHADYMEYEAKKKTDVAEEIEEKSFRMEEVLVVFIAVERMDESNPVYIIDRTAEEIENIAEKVDAKRIMLYPYAHLSSDLASSGSAIMILKKTAEKLIDFEVHRAPFGWYKSFQIGCKGHPLSELSRSIRPTPEEVVKREEKLESRWYILDLNGELIPVSEFDLRGYPNLKKFTDYEISGTRMAGEEPPHIRLMRSHEIADYEPGSDAGNLRWYPKGSLIKRLLEEHVSNMTAESGGMQVETPVMYDLSHPGLADYLDHFPARQYRVRSGEKEYFLRFAACFGQYLMKHDMTISYKNLPLKMYELSHYSFRREQSGELSGLRRLRTFTMPDMHTLVRDIDQAKDEFLNQYKLSMEWMECLGLDYEVAVRFVKDFYEENKEFADELVKIIKKPALIEMWDERSFYFVMKHEFNVIDTQDKASALSTVQIDIENAERFDINYVDEDGGMRHPLILHASISGGIDRNVYALLEKAYMDTNAGVIPMLPTWLSPTQVRLIPVADRHVAYVERVASRLNRRADVDDRNMSMRKKIMDAGKEWIPYVAVVGDDEIEGDFLTVTVRKESEIKRPKKVKMTIAELNERIEKETDGMPFRPLPLDMKLSKRPKFYG